MEAPETKGPLMLSMTAYLRPRTRIGKLFGVSLIRTIPLNQALAGFVGAIIGLVIASPLLPLLGFQAVAAGLALGAAGGALSIEKSPYKGENSFRYLLTKVIARQNSIKVDGERQRVYMGICPLRELALGEVDMVSLSVDVAPGAVDERGAPRHWTGVAPLTLVQEQAKS